MLGALQQRSPPPATPAVGPDCPPTGSPTLPISPRIKTPPRIFVPSLSNCNNARMFSPTSGRIITTTAASGFSNYFKLLCSLLTLSDLIQKRTWDLLIGGLILNKLENSSKWRRNGEAGKAKPVHTLPNIPNLNTTSLTVPTLPSQAVKCASPGVCFKYFVSLLSPQA